MLNVALQPMPILLIIFLAAGSSPTGSKNKAAQGASQRATGQLGRMGTGPVRFYCATGQAFTGPNAVHCSKNVIVARGPLWLCCDNVEIQLGKDVERLTCTGNVRSQRGDELMWSHRATFIPPLSKLILTGDPLLQRSGSLLRGERIIVDTEHDRAYAEQLRGILQRVELAPEKILAPADPERALPRACPVPTRPARGNGRAKP